MDKSFTFSQFSELQMNNMIMVNDMTKMMSIWLLILKCYIMIICIQILTGQGIGGGGGGQRGGGGQSCIGHG